ncbi:uncharacterized protein BT62DRAFT_929591 [Guyanagaster necrorhizus]|uniref:Uncharacterized protein n=1 Tax=Guyanagaster necrorhizus TaxID=856835 RepID=A0A9P7VX26_9AGAR|nr:uncharacterized protein BT62DRAFT_929591 [Guyanagaster necrorhizus MCA 3950]KAG7448502.1 hypothetical protein BT62DRAFT_929591 [Guyanagaster necrorhizus MCA 3950]
MAMDSFSWSDTFRAAFSTCMPCLAKELHDDPTNSGYQRLPQNLEHLLQDPGTDTEAETLSLHSNIGDNNRRRKKKRQPRRILTFFGLNLFGKPAIHLDEDEGDHTFHRSRTSTSRTSSTGFDSDAAPLDSSAIDSMTLEQLEERARAAEEEERHAKEERRKRRRERKEMKRLAQALAVGSVDGEEFEGFQGSGSVTGGYLHIPSPGFYNTPPPSHPEVETEADDGADLDGGMYVSRRDHHGSSGGGSDSRLTSSDASSQIRYHSQQLAPTTHLPNLTPSSLPVKKKKSSKSMSRSSGTSSQSPSLASPVGHSFSQILGPKGDVVGESGLPSRGLSMGGDRQSFRGGQGGAFLADHGAD